MSVNCDYFAAPDDAAAAAVIDAGPQDGVVDAKGIDPVVLLGQVETLLGGRSFDEQLDDPASGRLVASEDNDHLVVVAVGPELERRLAQADDAALPAVAEQWAQAEEFYASADVEVLTDVLQALKALAVRADAAGEHLYCWICV